MTPANDNDNTPRPRAFDVELAKHEPFIRLQCATRAGTLEAEDIYQETVARALEKWPRYRPEGSFSAWLVFLIREVIQQHGRKNRHKLEPLKPEHERHERAVQEDRVAISDALRALPEAEQDALVMKAAGYTGREIGLLTGERQTAVFAAIYSGRRKLVAANDNVVPVRKVA